MLQGSIEIARLRGAAPGPTLLLVGGVHGNEPAGITAARAVIAELAQSVDFLVGEVVALAANIPALAAGRRYLERDFNRQWTRSLVAAARAEVAAAVADAETTALCRLADEIDSVLARARGPVYVLDLHTTSAEGSPFSIVGDTETELDFAASFPLPGVLGLDTALDGVLVHYLAALGCTALVVEGGQHESELAQAHLEAAATIGLASSGVFAATSLPRLPAARSLLTTARGDLPSLIQVVSRHEVVPERVFCMVPGFATLQRTNAGTLLAHEAEVEIRAPFDGVLLLPLYQKLGTDGFFYGRDVKR